MTGTPRTEEKLLPLIAAADQQLAKEREAVERWATVRRRLEDALADAREAYQNGRAWPRPSWWGADAWAQDAMRGTGRAVDALTAALVALEAGPGEFGLLPEVFVKAADGEPVTKPEPGRLEVLEAERAALAEELERRRKGPGERRPYIFHGGGRHSRWEDGELRVYRDGAKLLLNRWEAAQLAGRVEPVAEAAA